MIDLGAELADYSEQPKPEFTVADLHNMRGWGQALATTVPLADLQAQGFMINQAAVDRAMDRNRMQLNSFVDSQKGSQ